MVVILFFSGKWIKSDFYVTLVSDVFVWCFLLKNIIEVFFVWSFTCWILFRILLRNRSWEMGLYGF